MPVMGSYIIYDLLWQMKFFCKRNPVFHMGYKVSYEIHILYRGEEKRPCGFENNFKSYDNTGKIVQNVSGIFDNTPAPERENSPSR